MDFVTAFLKEANGQPLATTICLVGLIVFLWWFIIERPKRSKEKAEANKQRHDDSVRIAEHMAANNEVVKNCTAAIEHSSIVIENVTKTNGLVQAQVSDLKSIMLTHDEHALEVKDSMAMVLTAVQMCTKR